MHHYLLVALSLLPRETLGCTSVLPTNSETLLSMRDGSVEAITDELAVVVTGTDTVGAAAEIVVGTSAT